MGDRQRIIEEAWEARASVGVATAGVALKDAVASVIAGLDDGTARVAEKSADGWTVHQWIKKAVLLSFRLEDNRVIEGGGTRYYDKVASKFGPKFDFGAAGFFYLKTPSMDEKKMSWILSALTSMSCATLSLWHVGLEDVLLNHDRVVVGDRTIDLDSADSRRAAFHGVDDVLCRAAVICGLDDVPRALGMNNDAAVQVRAAGPEMQTPTRPIRSRGPLI